MKKPATTQRMIIDQDVVQFATDTLAPIFGTPDNGLVLLVRLTRAFRAWRERVEFCQTCGVYAPIDPQAPSGHATRMETRFASHRSSRQGAATCSGTRRSTVWCGADINDLTAPALALFANQSNTEGD